MIRLRKKRYSYIRHPFSRTGWYCLGIGAAAALLTAAAALNAIRVRSEVSLFIAAVGLSAMLTDLCGLVFLFNALKEKKKNHLFTLTGGALLVGVLAVWIYVFMF